VISRCGAVIMPLIRCTRKLVAEMRTQVASAVEQANAALLGDWYANLLQIDRRKCVIFTSERTLLTFLAVARNRDAIRNYATLFQNGPRQLLASEGFEPGDVDRVLDDYQELTLAPTADRSVLGSLNDLARLAVGHVQDAGGLSGCELSAINHELNLTPMNRLGMASPLATTRSVLERGDLAAHSKGPLSPRRKKRPVRMELDAVRIERQGDAAILTPRDPDVAVTHLRLGPQVARMSDEEILACFNATIAAQDRLAAEHPWVATEVPPGRPQIRYHPQADQWVPRGGVVRCFIESDEDLQAIIMVDDQELSLEEFGKLLATYAGWGMRIEFTPDDATERRPRLVVRDPEEP
jgi:hypothetical protein